MAIASVLGIWTDCSEPLTSDPGTEFSRNEASCTDTFGVICVMFQSGTTALDSMDQELAN